MQRTEGGGNRGAEGCFLRVYWELFNGEALPRRNKTLKILQPQKIPEASYSPAPFYLLRALEFSTREVTAIELVDDGARLRQLMQAHGALVFNLCLRMTRDYFLAEDLTQDTFLAAYRGLQAFDGEHEAAWLTKIASRKCLDHLRSAAARTTQPTDELPDAPGPQSQQPENIFFEAHWDEVLRRACEELREPYRALAIAYYCEGRPLSQLARETGEALDALRSRSQRARGMLQKILKEDLRT